VDVPRTSFFSLPCFLAEERTQQPTRQNPYRTHWRIVRKMWECSVSFTVREHNQEILSCCSKKPLMCAKPYSPGLPNECINAVTVLACYRSPRPALMRFILHHFPSFFKCTAPLIDINILQCLLTILPLQSWTDFRQFTTFFCQECDYNVLFHANVYLRFAHLPYNWQNCTAANTRLVNDLVTVLPPSTYYYFQRTALHFWTTNKL